MNDKKIFLLGAATLLLIGILSSTIFVVSPIEQAIVFQFRETVRVVNTPGIHFKVPVIQEVMRFEKRVLPLEVPERLITLADQKPLSVDAFARWRIVDPLRFFQSLRDERVAENRLSSIMNDSVQSVLRRYVLTDLLSEKRVEIMEKIQTELNKNTERLGVTVLDVRLRRADLPSNVLPNVFERMRSDRKLQATGLRSEGQMQANEIRAKAESEAKIIISKTEAEAAKLRGEGDKESLRLLAEVTGRDPQFFSFYRTLQAYRETLKNDNTTYVLSPNSTFFDVLKSGKP
ncbi:MAG: protease modulator HflC [Alphaproteobacteria bacterium]|nr:protease modulator HflC [Alphaproteobacteria bacterium]NDC56071.1 protease modulator HflC [Alphaproteobacteria bacterium]NDG03728.1 protease modulator HflC [Alphaproteobacteria bacterium]